MTNIIPLSFKDNLVRVVRREDDGDEPWFVGKDVCSVLDLKNTTRSLDRLDPDEKGVHTVNTLGGVQDVLIVSEPGVFRLIFTSRKPEAEEFKRWLAHEVLPKLRRDGFFAVEARQGNVDAPPQRGDLVGDAPLAARVEAIRLGTRLWGIERGRTMWSAFGLPAVAAPPSPGTESEALACLGSLLLAPAPDKSAISVLIDRALYYGDGESRALLNSCGIRVPDDSEEGFYVANHHPWLVDIFRDTEWLPNWPRVLRRLPGTLPGGNHRFGGQVARSTFVPARYLDFHSA